MEEITKKKLDKLDIMALIGTAAIVIAIIIASIIVGRTKSDVPPEEKPEPETIKVTAATYDSSRNTLDITTPDGNTAHFHNYSVTFEATAETTTITLNKGLKTEIIITIEGEE
jgi:heme/copper-type cytochrome/quinol oxidase subunit 2